MELKKTQMLSGNRHHLAATLLRVALGVLFLAHAYAKFSLFTLPGTVRFFEANGFPGWTAYPVFAAELVGGLALVVGFKTRIAALGLIPIMVGALKTHLANGWMFTSAGGGWEFVAFLIAALAAQALLGSGAYALDGATSRAAPAPATRDGALV
ncbi:MAG TPA: DoxX family protein [Myxococcaceae bacterium]|nr:DoxX family protein [Myxococcaceae bacterium]